MKDLEHYETYEVTLTITVDTRRAVRPEEWAYHDLLDVDGITENLTGVTAQKVDTDVAAVEQMQQQ
jgi:hypothetical protein